MTPLLRGSSVALASIHDTALLDLDGVVYIGAEAVPGAVAAIAGARAAGMRVAYVTNNAARTPGTVAGHLGDLGVPAEPADVVTSAQAAATLLCAQVPGGAAVLVVGGEGLDEALVERKLRPVRAMADGPAAVVQGFSPDVGWRALAEGTYAVRAGLPWIASNLDSTVPTPSGLAPGNGALVEVIAAATGRRPVSAGKPDTPLHEEAMRRTGAMTPLVVGDRLDTDIEGANRAGVASLLVLTGVATPADLVLAGPQLRPTYVSRDLGSGLLGIHPQVEPADGGWRCGGWQSRITKDGVDLTGGGEPVDGLRALCVASWNHGVDDRQARGLVARLGFDAVPAR